MEIITNIVVIGLPLLMGAGVMKYYHKIPSREGLYHYGSAWCAANRDACVFRKERMKEYLKTNAPEVGNATNA